MLQLISKKTNTENLRSPRRGILSFELIVAAVVLGMAISLLLPGLRAASRVRQERQFEVLARVELNNLRRAAEEAGPVAAPPQLSAWFVARYPEAELSISAVPAAESWPAGDGVRLSISRPVIDEGRAAPVALIFWPSAGSAAGANP